MESSIKTWLALAVCGVTWTAGSLQAQDQMESVPPPPDPSAPASGNGPYVPPPDTNAPAPDQGAPDNGQADDGASFQTFYDNLSSQGTWIQSSDYGYVWQPNVSSPDWAPYTDGHWVYTDDGWTWVSDEPWGWATYHYGRWANLDGVGWCWVPGYTWAPAWVSWRYGNGYCGWAPLPPDSFVGIDYAGDGFSIGVGFHIGGDCDSYYGIGAGCYHFVPVNCLGYRNYHGYYARRADNFVIINHTTNVTSINVTRNGAGAGAGDFDSGRFHHVTTGGPSFAQVNAVAQTPVQRVALVHSNQPGGGVVANNSLALYAPRLNAASSPNFKPAYVAKSVDRIPINRGTDVTKPLAVNSHVMPPSLTSDEIQRAQLAQFNAPPHAKVVTADTQVQPVLQQSLTSLKPVAVASPTATQRVGVPVTAHVPSVPAAQFTPVERTYPGYSNEGNGSPRVYVPTPSYPSPQQHYVAPTTSPGSSSPRQYAPAPSSSPATSVPSHSSGGYSGGSESHDSSASGSNSSGSGWRTSGGTGSSGNGAGTANGYGGSNGQRQNH